MTAELRERLGLGDRELVAIVGAGGKSTILRTLGTEFAAAGKRVVVTTTTMLAADQRTDPLSWSADPAAVDALLSPGTALMVVTGTVPGKLTGPSIAAVQRLFTDTAADCVVVEADGARSMSIKAPAEHEPAIPPRSTTVVVVVSARAIGRPIGAVAHRPERVAALTNLSVEDPLTVEAAARLLLDPAGGLKNVPEGARVVIAITRVADDGSAAASQLSDVLAVHPRVARVVTIRED